MKIFATQEFIDELKSISKNNSHTDCEKNIINSISNKTLEQLKEGALRIGGNIDLNPFMRKRISKTTSGKSGGYRLYLWLYKIEDSIFLIFIHPKSSGRNAGTNITNEKQKELVKAFLKDKKDNNLIQVKINKTKDKFIKVKDKIIKS